MKSSLATRLGPGLLFSLLMVGSSEGAGAGKKADPQNEAYDALKKARAEGVQRCVQDLLALADECAAAGFDDDKAAFLKFVAKLEASAKAVGEKGGTGEGIRGRRESNLSGSKSTGSSSAPGPVLRERLQRKREDCIKRFINDMKILAQRCLDVGFPVHAYELLLWTLQHDPDNPALRKVLGEEAYRDKTGNLCWYRPWELEKVRKGLRFNPELGWLTPLQVEKLGEGDARRFLVGAEVPRGFCRGAPRDLNEFLKTCGDEKGFHDTRRLENYAMAGAAIHFFCFHNRGIYRENFMRYARSSLRGAGAIRMLYQGLGITEKQLQAEWEEFCRRPSTFSF